MEKSLKIRIEKPLPNGDIKVLYENVVNVPLSLSVPYEQIESTFRFLYSESKIYVHFIVL